MMTMTLGWPLVLLVLVGGPPNPKSAPEVIQIVDGQAPPECGFRGDLASEKALDGRQVDALLAVQRELLANGYREFAPAAHSAECFRSTRAYAFIVYPTAGAVGVLVLDSGACHEPGWRGADRQLLYEWSPPAPLKVHLGEKGAYRAAELERLAGRGAKCE